MSTFEIRSTVVDIDRIFPDDDYRVMRRTYAPSRVNINGEAGMPADGFDEDPKPMRFAKLNRWDGRGRLPKTKNLLLVVAAAAAILPIAARFIH